MPCPGCEVTAEPEKSVIVNNQPSADSRGAVWYLGCGMAELRPMVDPASATEPGPLPDLDPVLTLAQSLHTTPAAYAVLVGAGVSIAAGVPSAWGVVEALVRKRASQQGEDCGEDPAGWFRDRYGSEPQYEVLLEALASTPIERQRLLREFFEPPATNPDDPRRVEPSLAHRALARLVANGSVRVILTLNFDRLTESALREVGVEPTVVVAPVDLEGLAPLHTLQALVVHLHGDYLSASTMLNTRTELESYPEPVNDFLDRVLSSYGLLTVGWSAVYDPPLRAAVSRQTARLFTPYWVEPGELRLQAEDLRVARGAVKITATADEALGRLADAVTALDSRAARHALTLPVAVATAKRELSGRTTAINLHDQIRAEFNRLRNSEDQTRTNFGSLPEGDTSVLLYGRIDEALKVPCGLVATAAYWGSAATDRWWLPEIEWFSQPVRGGNGLTALLRSVNVPAAHLLYVAGTAAIAAQRYDLLLPLLSDLQVTDSNGRREPLAYQAATPGWVYADGSVLNRSLRVFETHSATFVEHLGLGQAAYEDAWEAFELLRLVQTTYQLPSSPHDIVQILKAREALEFAQQVFDTAESTGDGDELDSARVTRADALQEAERRLGAYAYRVAVEQLHVRVAYDHSQRRHPPVAGQRMLADVQRARTRHPLVEAGFCSGKPTHLAITVEAVNAAIGRVGREAAFRSSDGWIPDYFWLDTLQRPDR